MPGVVCCVCNHKGGVGKTSVAVNLGAALSIQKKRVLVIDNDPQANATKILLPEGTIIRNSLYELLSSDFDDSQDIESFIYPAKHTRLYILPNVEETSALELTFAETYPDSLTYLRERIRNYLVDNFDFTLIDCLPSMGLFVANALYTSDCAVVPIDAGSSYSLDGLRKVLSMIDTIKQEGNPDLRFLKMVINRVDKRTAISKVVISDINERFGPDKVFKTNIQINTPFQQAEYLRDTIFSAAPNSRGAGGYRSLAREFIQSFEKTRSS